MISQKKMSKNIRYICEDRYVRPFSVCMHECVLSHVLLFETPWTIACQALLSIGFFRQEYWSGLPFPPSGDLPNPGIQHASLATLALASRLSTTEPPGKHFHSVYIYQNTRMYT